MTTDAKPLSLEEEQEYRRDSGHGFDHYCSVTNFGVRRLLATIEQQRARVAVLEEALREMLGIVTIVRRGGAVPHEAVDRMLTKTRVALAGKEVSG